MFCKSKTKPKVSEKRGNRSEFHSERNYYLQNCYFNKADSFNLCLSYLYWCFLIRIWLETVSQEKALKNLREMKKKEEGSLLPLWRRTVYKVKQIVQKGSGRPDLRFGLASCLVQKPDLKTKFGLKLCRRRKFWKMKNGRRKRTSVVVAHTGEWRFFFVLTHCALNLTFEERNMYKKKAEKRRDLARLIRNKQNVDSNKDGQRSCSTLNQNWIIHKVYPYLSSIPPDPYVMAN